MTKRLAVLMLMLLVAAGCGKKDSSTAQPAPPGGAAPGATTPGAAKPLPAQIPAVVARVNGQDVTKSELEMAVRTIEERAQGPVPPDQRDTVYRQVLDRIVGFHLLVQEAKNRKVVAAPWEVDGQIEQIRKQFPNEEAFNQMLKTRGVTFEQLRAETADTVSVNQMLQKEIGGQISVTDPEIKTFFDENKARFRQEDSVHASHILIRWGQQADAATKAKAKAQAEDLLKQMKKGVAFADLAKKYSQDPASAPNGGDLGFFSKGQMMPAFEQAAFALQVGQTSAVVETPAGFHIIKVQEAKPGRELTFDEVKEQIADYLKQQQREKKSQEFVEKLKAKGKVEILI